MHKKPKHKMSKHHRKCRSHGHGGKNNVVTVKDYQHRAWHALFLNYKADKVAELINKFWIDPDYTFVCVKTEEYYAALRELESTQSEVSHLQLVSSTNSHG